MKIVRQESRKQMILLFGTFGGETVVRIRPMRYWYPFLWMGWYWLPVLEHMWLRPAVLGALLQLPKFTDPNYFCDFFEKPWTTVWSKNLYNTKHQRTQVFTVNLSIITKQRTDDSTVKKVSILTNFLNQLCKVFQKLFSVIDIICVSLQRTLICHEFHGEMCPMYKVKRLKACLAVETIIMPFQFNLSLFQKEIEYFAMSILKTFLRSKFSWVLSDPKGNVKKPK